MKPIMNCCAKVVFVDLRRCCWDEKTFWDAVEVSGFAYGRS